MRDLIHQPSKCVKINSFLWGKSPALSNIWAQAGETLGTEGCAITGKPVLQQISYINSQLAIVHLGVHSRELDMVFAVNGRGRRWLKKSPSKKNKPSFLQVSMPNTFQVLPYFVYFIEQQHLSSKAGHFFRRTDRSERTVCWWKCTFSVKHCRFKLTHKGAAPFQHNPTCLNRAQQEQDEIKHKPVEPFKFSYVNNKCASMKDVKSPRKTHLHSNAHEYQSRDPKSRKNTHRNEKLEWPKMYLRPILTIL